MARKTVVLYHSDADGYCAGAIAWLAGVTGEYHPVDYGQDMPEIEPGSLVYMLDYALQPFERMVKLNEWCELHWVDHHKSAMDAALRVGFVPSGGMLTSVGLAACELAWSYFYPVTGTPVWVNLIGRYDVWDHRDSRTVPFHYGLLSHDIDPAVHMSLWRKLCNDGRVVDKVLSDGRAIQRYTEIQYGRLAADTSFELQFEGLKFIAFNAMGTGSSIADSVWDQEAHDAILTFGWSRDHWTVGLYTEKPGVDVSAVAVKYGGGGHRGAAGFQCSYLPFDVWVDKDV